MATVVKDFWRAQWINPAFVGSSDVALNGSRIELRPGAVGGFDRQTRSKIQSETVQSFLGIRRSGRVSPKLMGLAHVAVTVPMYCLAPKEKAAGMPTRRPPCTKGSPETFFSLPELMARKKS